jgi:hypothetical protein
MYKKGNETQPVERELTEGFALLMVPQRKQ